MDDLPIPQPTSPAAQNLNAATASTPPTGTAAGSPQNPDLLQDDAVEQIEAAILQTTTSPAERALQIHAIKTAYLKARYNIDIKGITK